MSEKFTSGSDEERVKAAQALYGAINSAFEDWESHDIPPHGYDALFTYDVSTQAVRDVQTDPNFSLRELGIYDLRAPARWDVGIAAIPSLGRLGLVGVSMPLITPGQRLNFIYESVHDDTYAVYLSDGDRTDPLPNSQHPALVDLSYLEELLARAGIDVPDLNVGPAERTLALAKIANQASIFEIVQRKSLPVHPTQEIVFEKITSRSAPKKTAHLPLGRNLLHDPRNHPHQPESSTPIHTTTLRAIYTQTDEEGGPLYQQVITFEGSGAMVSSRPLVELYTYQVDELTGDVTKEHASTDEQISAAILGMVESGLFDVNYGGEDPQAGGDY